jgi:hypothetical protein
VGLHVQVPAALALEPVHWILGAELPFFPPLCVEQAQVRFVPLPTGKALDATVLHLSPILPLPE